MNKIVIVEEKIIEKSDKNDIINDTQNETKDRFALALGWWSALWLSHIWVIKYLEEKWIKIKEISGTSMWAIIASFYAFWKDSDFMIDFAKSINFLKLVDFDLQSGVLKWDKIYDKLSEVFWETNIEELDINLKIVATNIENWEKKVFQEWKIVDAIRSSISLPGIFKPYNIWGDTYIDWWIISNLPVDVLDWNEVIAVSVIKDVKSKLVTKRHILWFDIPVWFFNLNYQVLQRSFLLMMKTNEQISVNTEWKNVTLIKPDLWDMDFLSFNRLDELVEKGYNEAVLVLWKK